MALNEQLEELTISTEQSFIPTENDQGAFEREIELCELFEFKEGNEKFEITFNVSNNRIIVWVYYDNDDDWDNDRGKNILASLTKQLKLHLVGYKPDTIEVAKCPGASWEDRKRTTYYHIPLDLKEFDIIIFSHDKNYLQYNGNDYNL